MSTNLIRHVIVKRRRHECAFNAELLGDCNVSEFRCICRGRVVARAIQCPHRGQLALAVDPPTLRQPHTANNQVVLRDATTLVEVLDYVSELVICVQDGWNPFAAGMEA